MAHSPAFTINNYTARPEVIELDNEPTSVQQDFRRIVFTDGRRQGTVLPTPSCNTFMRDPAKKWRSRRRCSNTLLVTSSLFSLISFILVVGLFLGFIEPRNIGRFKSCRCPPPSPSSNSALKREDTTLDETKKDLEREMKTIKEILEEQKEKLSTRDNDIIQMNKKFGGHQNNVNTTLTQVSLKMNKIISNITKLTLRQVKAEENFRTMSENISERLGDVVKDGNDMKRSLLVNEIKCNTKFDQLKEEMSTNVTKISRIATKNSFDITTFVTDTSKQILEAKNMTRVKFQQLERETKTNLTKVSQTSDQVASDLKKFSVHTSKQFGKTRNLTEIQFQRFQTNIERNLTFAFQSIDDLFGDFVKFRNDTNKKLLMNNNTMNKLFDPTKFRGLRGYNGTAGQQGPAGPAGPPGPPATIDFTNCKHRSQQQNGDKGVPQLEESYSDTKSSIALAVSCESSLKGGQVGRRKKNIPTGNKHTCFCNNYETSPKSFTCTMKYLLCTLT